MGLHPRCQGLARGQDASRFPLRGAPPRGPRGTPACSASVAYRGSRRGEAPRRVARITRGAGTRRSRHPSR
ncbi:hypothetical protein A176_002314 [Myxococcus hansupus]|uniref:Uncharacterized protein n=1 Tax=Pseudomyxococcus hansupus TaxID=1297742 RepID=A0A0H4XBS5_9BACT|nr:hypothetical protein A176_002314 [Myxococcus hansupus]